MDAKQSPLRTAWTHSQWHLNTKRTLFTLPFLFSLLKFGILKSGCGHTAPDSFVSLVPIQVLLGLGAAHLYSSTGASAYGIPRYSYTVLPFGSVSSLPTIVPDVVFTSGALSLAWIWRERASEFKQSYLIAFSSLRSVFFLSFSEIDCELHFEFQICNHFHLEQNVPCLPPNPPPPGPSQKDAYRQVPGIPKRIQEVRENCRTFLPDALKRSEFPVGKEWNIMVKYTLKYFYFHKEKNIEFSFLSALWWQIRKRETFEGFIKKYDA